MSEAATKLPVRTEERAPQRASARQSVRPFETLHREIDRLFEDFDGGFWRSPFRRSAFGIEPFWRRELSWGTTPAVDIAEKADAYEITAELPGMDEKHIEVKVSNGELTIKGEKRDEKEEKRKDYYLNERSYGAFERRFTVPEGVNADKIEASFKKGVLTVVLPKTPEAQKPEKKIEVKAS